MESTSGPAQKRPARASAADQGVRLTVEVLVMEAIGEVVSVSLRWPKGNLAPRNSIALLGYSGVSSSCSSATFAWNAPEMVIVLPMRLATCQPSLSP
jgi:hypothetical protein